MVTYRSNLSVTPGGTPLRLKLNQNDVNFVLKFDLYSTLGNFVMESGSTVKLQGRRPDGGEFNINGSYSGKTVTFNGNSSITTAAGLGIAEVTIIHNDSQLSTSNIEILIEPAA